MAVPTINIIAEEPLISDEDSHEVKRHKQCIIEPTEAKLNEISETKEEAKANLYQVHPQHVVAQTEVRSSVQDGSNLLPGTVASEGKLAATVVFKSNGKSTVLRSTIDSSLPLAVEIAGLEDYVQEDKVYVVTSPSTPSAT